MRDTRLVQRLDKKPRSDLHAKMSQVFGGGLVMLSAEGWKTIQSICDLHYMGAAEYEFGTIPKCLESLARDHEKLVTFPLLIKRADIKPNWNHESAHRRARQFELAKAKKEGVKPPRAKKLVANVADATVYVICRKDDMVEVGDRIRELAKCKWDLKRGDGFASALDPATDYDREPIGWLELDNGFMFFLGHEEYCGMSKLFGLTPEEKVRGT
jgi:hypothetical protein